MCTKYQVCGYSHKKRYKRDKKGKFVSYRPYLRAFLIGFGIYAVSMIGGNTIWGLAKSLEKVFVVENSQAVEELTLEDKIYKVAKRFGISGYQMWRTIECETNVRNIQSEIRDPTGPNGREDSWGYPQIHLPSWPDVSREEALNEDFAIKWMAEHWNKAKWFAYNRKTDKCIK